MNAGSIFSDMFEKHKACLAKGNMSKFSDEFNDKSIDVFVPKWLLPLCLMDATAAPPCPLDAAFSLQEDLDHTSLFAESRHPNRVLEGLNRLRLNGAFCDVVLCCGGQEFPCHRNVLASISSYFEVMFTAAMMESRQQRVVISGVEPQTFEALVGYAYTSEVVISTANVQELLAAANLLDVTAVKEACCRYMERHMDLKNCVGIHLFADAHSCKMLEELSMDYILEHFSDIYQQEEFLSLSVDKLTEILASDHLNVPKEDMVFEAAMLWLDKCPTRKQSQSIEKVIEQVRMPLISPSYIHDVIKSLEVMKEDWRCQWGCQRFLYEAKFQHLYRPPAIPGLYRPRARPRRTTVIVAVGGDENMKYKCRTIESFDPVTGLWNTLGRLPFPVKEYGLVVTGSTLYLAGGLVPVGPGYTTYSREMWRYDLHRNTWFQMAPMNLARRGCNLVMLDGCVFAVGGYFGGYYQLALDNLERYDPKTNTWQLIESANMSDFRCYGNPMVELDGLIYLLGGSHMTHNQKKVRVKNITDKLVECYNPNTNQWTMCAPMTERRRSPGVAVLDGKIYILGGIDNSEERSKKVLSMERYCEETDAWETVGQTPQGLHSLRCFSVRRRNDASTAQESEAAEYNGRGSCFQEFKK